MSVWYLHTYLGVHTTQTAKFYKAVYVLSIFIGLVCVSTVHRCRELKFGQPCMEVPKAKKIYIISGCKK